MNRTEVETEVRKRRQTPEWAERQAEANGWEPYAPVQTPWSYWGGAGKWPINFAVLWMSCPTPEEATLQWNRLHYWEQHVWRDVPNIFYSVQHSLSEALRNNHLLGYGKKNNSDAEFCPIPQDQWDEMLYWETDRDYTTASIPGSAPSWLDVRVARSNVSTWWSDLNAANVVDDDAVELMSPMQEAEASVQVVAVELEKPSAERSDITKEQTAPATVEPVATPALVNNEKETVKHIRDYIRLLNDGRLARGEGPATRKEIEGSLWANFGKHRVRSRDLREALSYPRVTAVRGADRIKRSKKLV